jgi:hypothetical protein
MLYDKLRQRLDDFIGKCVLYCGIFFYILTSDMISAVYRVDIICRTCDGKPLRQQFLNVAKRVKETATGLTFID